VWRRISPDAEWQAGLEHESVKSRVIQSEVAVRPAALPQLIGWVNGGLCSR